MSISLEEAEKLLAMRDFLEHNIGLSERDAMQAWVNIRIKLDAIEYLL